MNKKYCFVILHYKAYKETCKCIEYLTKLDNQDDIQIIIIDNGSCHDSSKIIEEKISDFTNIMFIGLEFNVGFARGNNIGYTIAKHSYNAEYIIIMNNDVYIHQRDFIRRIDNVYEQHRYDIIGPDIITKDGKHQNPLGDFNVTPKLIKKEMIFNRIRLLITFFPDNFRNFIIKFNQKRIENRIHSVSSYEILENVILHGACIIYSQNYVKNYEFAFHPCTFMYGEEYLLYYFACKNQLKVGYSKELIVHHEEDASTNTEFCNNKLATRFVAKNSLESLKKIKEIIKIDAKR